MLCTSWSYGITTMHNDGGACSCGQINATEGGWATCYELETADCQEWMGSKYIVYTLWTWNCKLPWTKQLYLATSHRNHDELPWINYAMPYYFRVT